MNTFDPDSFAKILLSGTFDFEQMSEELWHYQLDQNKVIRDYCKRLGKAERQSIPIEFFKHFEMRTGDWQEETIFESSGTTGQTPSRHFVKDVSLYDQITIQGFHHFFEEGDYKILALLPSYLERGSSSLVHMVKNWIDHFGLPGSGFYLYNFEELRKAIYEAMDAGEKIILIGVAYALLDFVEEEKIKLPADAIVMETGGMKGRKKEMIREELHAHLREGLGIEMIRSEYGMTELMSQAYTVESGRFRTAPSMQVLVSDIHLNRLIQKPGISGRLHIIDLANIHSCAFIATDDIGRIHEDGSFEVLGRLDTAEIRGCSLMYE
ncbi:MAG: acyl transferase [Bacteroidota bacterium]